MAQRLNRHNLLFSDEEEKDLMIMLNSSDSNDDGVELSIKNNILANKF